MSTQAKNRTLCYIVGVMLLAIAYLGNMKEPQPSRATTQILIPQLSPIFIKIPEPTYAFVDEFECLRTNLYHEAGNQGRRGMEAVALVTLTRVKTKHYPDTVCGVVTQAVVVNGAVKRNRCQFSWYCDGKSDVPNLKNKLEQEAWDRATLVAREALEGKVKDFLGGATHYHATYVNPKFANVPQRYHRVAKVGIHVFYRDIALKYRT
jgi:N-acetylmuramoyl-L-alanine amidase